MTMMMLQSSRSTARLLKRFAGQSHIWKQRVFQSTASEEAHLPLFLWLGDDPLDASTSKQKLLLPVMPSFDEPSVQTSSDIVQLVNEHYEKEQQFVGGMGEGDPGVWFAAVGGSKDTLDYAPLIQESIQLVKQERHGVPFGLYTSGVLTEEVKVPLSEIGVDSIQVSLFAGSPPEYKDATGSSAATFGQVCGFIADASEQGVAVEVGVLKKYASSARELATSLGARHVHIYEQE